MITEGWNVLHSRGTRKDVEWEVDKGGVGGSCLRGRKGRNSARKVGEEGTSQGNDGRKVLLTE